MGWPTYPTNEASWSLWVDISELALRAKEQSWKDFKIGRMLNESQYISDLQELVDFVIAFTMKKYLEIKKTDNYSTFPNCLKFIIQY